MLAKVDPDGDRAEPSNEDRDKDLSDKIRDYIRQRLRSKDDIILHIREDTPMSHDNDQEEEQRTKTKGAVRPGTKESEAMANAYRRSLVSAAESSPRTARKIQKQYGMDPSDPNLAHLRDRVDATLRLDKQNRPSEKRDRLLGFQRENKYLQLVMLRRIAEELGLHKVLRPAIFPNRDDPDAKNHREYRVANEIIHKHKGDGSLVGLKFKWPLPTRPGAPGSAERKREPNVYVSPLNAQNEERHGERDGKLYVRSEALDIVEELNYYFYFGVKFVDANGDEDKEKNRAKNKRKPRGGAGGAGGSPDRQAGIDRCSSRRRIGMMRGSSKKIPGLVQRDSGVSDVSSADEWTGAESGAESGVESGVDAPPSPPPTPPNSDRGPSSGLLSTRRRGESTTGSQPDGSLTNRSFGLLSTRRRGEPTTRSQPDGSRSARKPSERVLRRDYTRNLNTHNRSAAQTLFITDDQNALINGTVSCMLVYLTTFGGIKPNPFAVEQSADCSDTRFQDEVLLALNNGIKVIVCYDVGTKFDDYIKNTPQVLIDKGIFKAIAKPINHHRVFKTTSMTMLAMEIMKVVDEHTAKLKEEPKPAKPDPKVGVLGADAQRVQKRV